MSKIYAKCPAAITDKVSEIISKYHPTLAGVGIKIACLTVANTEEDEPALLLHGYPCAAVVKILGAKDRARGVGDAEIVFDEVVYNDLSAEEQNALIDHELTHLEVKRRPKTGKPVFDAYKRPALQMKLHDRQFGWFDEVAKRHGAKSMECKQATGLVLSGKQVYFNFDLKSKLGDGVTASVKLM